MAFQASIEIDGQKFDVRVFYLIVHKELNAQGRPNIDPIWGVVVKIDMTDDTTVTKWMLNSNKQLDATLTVFKTDEEDSSLKEFKFKNALCGKMCDVLIADRSYAITQFNVGGKQVEIGEEMLILGKAD